MFEQLTVIEFPSNKEFDQNMVEGLQAFYLATCQRTLIATLDQVGAASMYPEARILNSEAAYRHLLSIVCGLQSRLIGETEIVAQYRSSLKSYSTTGWRQSVLLRILERILKDAKEIRTQYLQQIGQYSYAGLSKKLLLERTPKENILILGSGALAEDLCKVLNRHFPVHILARNQTRTKELVQRYSISNAGNWDQGQNLLGKFKAIINTIPNFPAETTKELLQQWSEGHANTSCLWIDLSNSALNNQSNQLPSSVMTLGHLFELGAELTKEKEIKVHRARMALDQIVTKRYQHSHHAHFNVAITTGIHFAHAGEQI